MTNWKTITTSINRLRELETILAGSVDGYTKKEQLMMKREHEKLEKSIGGIKEMGGRPDAIFIIDTNKEKIAIQEANTLGIPVFAVIDSNCDPAGIAFPFPGNDDALRAIELYCDLFANAVLSGLQAEMSKSGKDLGASKNPVQKLPTAEVVEEVEVKKQATAV